MIVDDSLVVAQPVTGYVAGVLDYMIHICMKEVCREMEQNGIRWNEMTEGDVHRRKKE